MELAKLPTPELIPELVKGLRRDFRSMILEIARENAVFKAKITEGNRITIPDAEREATGLKVGDIVQVIAIPIKEGK